MARLIYSTIASLDGYVADEDGNFDWAAPDEEVHAFVNELERPVGTYLYGRRMYETMVFWETMDTGADQPPVMHDFAEIWRAADKVVYSRTLGGRRARGRGSSASSTPTRSGELVASRARRGHRRGRARRPGIRGRAWSTSARSSSPRSWWAPASARFPTVSSLGSSSWTQRRFDSGFVYLRYGVRR